MVKHLLHYDVLFRYLMQLLYIAILICSTAAVSVTNRTEIRTGLFHCDLPPRCDEGKIHTLLLILVLKGFQS